MFYNRPPTLCTILYNDSNVARTAIYYLSYKVYLNIFGRYHCNADKKTSLLIMK